MAPKASNIYQTLKKFHLGDVLCDTKSTAMFAISLSLKSTYIHT